MLGVLDLPMPTEGVAVSLRARVTAADEWCAEAYMETDYSTLTQSDFERVVRNYAVYRLVGASLSGASNEDEDAESERDDDRRL